MIDSQELLQPAAGKYFEALRSATNAIHVCLPGTVLSFDPEAQTVSVRLCITGQLNDTAAEMPMLMDVPVYFPGGASMAITYGVNPGDDCLVVFADSCIDSWFLRGDVQKPFFNRKHDLSDGFALVGFRPKPRAVQMDDKPFAVRMKVNGEWQVPLYIDNNGIVHANMGGD